MRNRKYLKNIGLPPGTLLKEERSGGAASLSCFIYGPDGYEEKSLKAEELKSLRTEKQIVWLDMSDITDSGTLQTVGDHFGLSSLSLENIQTGDPRPKINEFTTYSHITLRMLKWDSENETFDSEQLHIILGSGFVISLQEKAGDVFDNVRERIRGGAGRIRRKKADYLTFSLIDSIVDNYLIVCDKLQDRQEFIEEILTEESPEQSLHEIAKLKKEMIHLKRSLTPLREVLLTLLKRENPLITADTYRFFRDVLNNLLLALDITEHLRDILGSQHDSLISTISLQMNNVMKILTIMASIFIPLTFIAGIYGMNFDFMPELHFKWAYPAVLTLMGLMIAAMVVFFRRKKWF